MKRSGIIPNQAESEFLKVSYNRFYDLFEEIINDNFWERDEWYRLSRIKEGFSVYTELLDYIPIKWTLVYFKKIFPPSQAELAEDFIKFLRNVFTHFPLYEKWSEIYITKNLVTWSRSGQIDKFLKTYKGKEEIKFRFWEEEIKRMTYISIKFPKTYSTTDKIFLRDIMDEKEGIKFCFILMKRVLNSQVVSTK